MHFWYECWGYPKIKSLADYNIAQFEYMKSSAEKEKEPVQEPCTKEKEKDNGFEMEM